MFRKFRIKDIMRIIKKVEERIGKVEAAIIFGSATRSGCGEWSDLDLLVVTDNIQAMNPLERFKIIVELTDGKIDLFIYSYDELERMMYRGNPLALSTLIEGEQIISSNRVLELAEKARRLYKRIGRMWIRR